ncbi:MAG: epimerase [Myxococcales bacterium]|nr:epimerase [Myxococcales bacterium]
MKILILGGTGWLGPALVDAALARGHSLTLFNRNESAPDLFPTVERIVGDRLGDLSELRGRTWDVVIDTWGPSPGIVSRSARALADAVDRYVYMGTIFGYANGEQHGLDETGPLQRIDDPDHAEVTIDNFGALKAMAEAAAEAELPNRVLTMRMGLLTGPGDPHDLLTCWPVRVAEQPRVLAPGRPSDLVQFIDVRDVAAFTISMIERAEVGPYNTVGPAQPYTMGELLEQCRASTGSSAELVWVDEAFLQAHDVRPWVDLPVWCGRSGPRAGYGTRSNARALSAGLTLRPIADTIRDIMHWWSSQPAERRQLRTAVSDARQEQLLSAWVGQSSDLARDDGSTMR